MKTFLLLAFSFTIALAQVVSAEDEDKVKAAPKTRSHVQAPKHVAPQSVAPKRVAPQRVGPSRTTVSQVPQINQTTVRANQYHPKVQSTARVYTKPTVPIAKAPQTSTTVQADTNVRNRNSQNRTNTNWQNQTSGNLSWADACRRHRREHHDRDWWSSHFTRFALFGSGYYFWDSGYWYPAYGYDPYYNSYSYDEPIYGYQDWDPGQVISSVQAELQRLGYYRYAVDGLMGPATRAALANFQRDNSLAITSAIDRPTLQSLGLG